MNKLEAIVNSAKKAWLKKQKSQSSKSGYLWTSLQLWIDIGQGRIPLLEGLTSDLDAEWFIKTLFPEVDFPGLDYPFVVYFLVLSSTYTCLFSSHGIFGAFETLQTFTQPNKLINFFVMTDSQLTWSMDCCHRGWVCGLETQHLGFWWQHQASGIPPDRYRFRGE